VNALIERPGRTVDVPLELDAPGAPQQESIERVPGHDPKYSKLVGDLGVIRISPHPEHAGLSQLYVTCYTAAIGGEQPIDRLVVTVASGRGPTRQQPLRRLGPGSFVADVKLAPGTDTIAVVARTKEGTRLRSTFELRIPPGAG
jgi:hypothetical protein